MTESNLRWWGWGTLDQSYPLENSPEFWPTFGKCLHLSPEELERVNSPVPLSDISLRPSRLDDPVIQSLYRLLGEKAVRVDKRSRIEHAYGKSYRDLLRARAGYFPHPPDAVIYPSGQGQIVSTLSWAAEREVSIIPFGGGSSVVGGVEPEEGDRPVITMDLSRLNRVLGVDAASQTARVQAGIKGPLLEEQLLERGFTLGHFPQSFRFSTLGGWIATRSRGYDTTAEHRIENLTQMIKAVTPVGIIETRGAFPGSGSNIAQLLIGSEGIYGVITEATISLQSIPTVQDYRGILFNEFRDGVAAYREIMQNADIRPTIARLSDAADTAAYMVLDLEPQGLRRLRGSMMGWYLDVRGFDLAEDNSLMILGFEGDAEAVSQQWNLAMEVCGDYRSFPLGRTIGQSWIRERYKLPYLRDALLNRGIMVDTLRTATGWSRLPQLYEALRGAVKGAIIATGGGPGYVMTRISHASDYGALLSVTFLGRQVPGGDCFAQQEQWQAIKQSAMETILANGGTLSHQYGVGREHISWMGKERGDVGFKVTRAVKQSLDPYNIMNPGVVLPV